MIEPVLSRDDAFSRITVDYLQSSGARVAWTLRRTFHEPGPYEFQLQVGETGVPDPEAWKDVGAPATDVGFLIDNKKRALGKEFDTHYRVALTTTTGTRYSEGVPATGILNHRDWLLARNLIRIHRLRLRLLDGWLGYLFKRMRDGEIPCSFDAATAVINPLTGGVIDPNYPLTKGTEFVDGYFKPVEFQFDMTATQWGGEEQGGEPGRTIEPMVQEGFAIGMPRITAGDIFAHKHSDRRFEVWPVKAASDFRGVPLLVECELRQLNSEHVAYTLELP